MKLVLRRIAIAATMLVVLGIGFLFAASSLARKPLDLGVVDGRFAPCPSPPNCVSTMAEDSIHKARPLPFTGEIEAVMDVVEAHVVALARTKVVIRSGVYLHAEVRSRIFRFVDDLEVYLDVGAGLVHFRSASRIGWSDMGVNSDRVESLRAALASELSR